MNLGLEAWESGWYSLQIIPGGGGGGGGGGLQRGLAGWWSGNKPRLGSGLESGWVVAWVPLCTRCSRCLIHLFLVMEVVITLYTGTSYQRIG